MSKKTWELRKFDPWIYYPSKIRLVSSRSCEKSFIFNYTVFFEDICKSEELKVFVGDICDSKSSTVQSAFKGVNSVFHCAALVSIEYPPNFKELDRVNVCGTSAVVDLCVQHNVKRLIYTSCASVCLVPFKGYSTFTIVINQTESKANTPIFNAQDAADFDKSFLIPGYSSSKLRAETIILNSNGALLNNQKGRFPNSKFQIPNIQ